ncbi:MAG TPA: LemA family protein [Chitinophagales bacterium]|nr:LemA family protein [Chitinophagales bacterium]
MKINRTWIILGIVILVVILIYSSCKGTYNSMVSKSQDTQSKWGDVESAYQRRWDLYNTVVKVIQGSAQFEQQTLTAVIEARSKATSIQVDASKLSPDQIAAFQQAQNQYSGAFGRLLAVVEQYPDLKTTQAFINFQTDIVGTENRINKARGDFNESVQGYNTYIKSFPTNLFAGMFGFAEKGYFKANEGTQNPPDINFNNSTPAPSGSTQK